MEIKRNSILKLVGTLSNKEAEEIKKNIIEGRKKIRERMNRLSDS